MPDNFEKLKNLLAKCGVVFTREQYDYLIYGKFPEEILRKLFPHGHPDFITKVIEEIALHSEKNFDYAFGGDPCGNFKRIANILKMYPKLDISDPAVVAFVYALKQIDAYLWIKSNKHETKVEGKSSRLRDVSVYCKIIDILDTESKI